MDRLLQRAQRFFPEHYTEQKGPTVRLFITCRLLMVKHSSCDLIMLLQACCWYWKEILLSKEQQD